MILQMIVTASSSMLEGSCRVIGEEEEFDFFFANLNAFFFVFVVWLLRLGLPVLCWIAVVRVDIPVLFLILGERLPVLPHGEWYLLWAFRRWLLRCRGKFPLSQHSEGFWSGMDAVFCQMLSLHLMRVSYGSWFFSCWYDESHWWFYECWTSLVSRPSRIYPLVDFKLSLSYDPEIPFLRETLS